MSAPPVRAFYLSSERGGVYALFDAASEEAPDLSIGVLLCPLFGNDDLCSYRSRREWARTLSCAGRPTLRIDLLGTGDSAGGPRDPERLEAWTNSIATGARWLREEAGVASVAAIGVGLGGLLSYLAASMGAPIDDLVLWAVPSQGRTLVREMRALARLEASYAAQHDEGLMPAGGLASGGFLLSPETVTHLEALDLTALELPRPGSTRLMLLERDGIEVDPRLRGHLEQAGASVTLSPGPGYGHMVAPPQQSQQPRAVFAEVEAWLAGGPRPPHVPRYGSDTGRTPVRIHDGPSAVGSSMPADDTGATTGEAPPEPAHSGSREGTSDELELMIDGARVRERPLMLSDADGRLAAILAEGDHRADLCAVLLNAGALRHIGPNRMWVEIARRWAARGVPTLRIDLAGIGDSDGDAGSLEQDAGLYVTRYVDQTRRVLEDLAARGLPQRFVLAGLCSGAYWSLHTALHDERVVGAYMINPRAMFWDTRIAPMRNVRDLRKVRRPATWRKLARGEIQMTRLRDIGSGLLVAAKMLARRSWSDLENARLEHTLDTFERAGTDLVWIFTPEEPLVYELERSGGMVRMMSRPNVLVENIPWPVGSHTLEPLAVQRAVHGMLDAAIDRQLQRLTTEAKRGGPLAAANDAAAAQHRRDT